MFRSRKRTGHLTQRLFVMEPRRSSAQTWYALSTNRRPFILPRKTAPVMHVVLSSLRTYAIPFDDLNEEDLAELSGSREN